MVKLTKILDSLLHMDILPGRENIFWHLINDLYPDRFDSIIDTYGNCLLMTKNYRPGGILIEAHSDIVALIVSEVCKERNQYICKRIGMIAPWDVRGQWVDIHTLNGEEISGVILAPSPHIFAKTKYDNYLQPIILCAEEQLNIGDIVTYPKKVSYWNDGTIFSPYLDNKASMAAILASLWNMTSMQQDNIAVCFSVKEEICASDFRYTLELTRPSKILSMDVDFSGKQSIVNVKEDITNNGLLQMRGLNAYRFIEQWPGADYIYSYLIPCKSVHTAVENMNIKDIIDAQEYCVDTVARF